MLQRIFGLAFLCGSFFLIWQGYENSRMTKETLEMSRNEVCDQFGGCMRAYPTKSKSDIIRRQYQWMTLNGPYVATCKRSMLFSGAWSCTSEAGKLGIGGGY